MTEEQKIQTLRIYVNRNYGVDIMSLPSCCMFDANGYVYNTPNCQIDNWIDWASTPQGVDFWATISVDLYGKSWNDIGTTPPSLMYKDPNRLP